MAPAEELLGRAGAMVHSTRKPPGAAWWRTWHGCPHVAARSKSPVDHGLIEYEVPFTVIDAVQEVVTQIRSDRHLWRTPSSLPAQSAVCYT